MPHRCRREHRPSNQLTLTWLAALVLVTAPGCKKTSKSKDESAAAGPKSGELVAGGVCRKGPLKFRHIRVVYDDDSTGRIGCGELMGKKEELRNSKASPVAAIYLPPYEAHNPNQTVQFYDARGKKLKRAEVYALNTAYIHDHRYLVYQSMPPTLNGRCVVMDLKKRRSWESACKVLPAIRGHRIAFLHDAEGPMTLTCVNTTKRQTRKVTTLPDLRDDPGVRWSSDTEIEVKAVEAKTGKPYQKRFKCPM